MAHQRRYESEGELAAWLAGCEEEGTGPGAAGVAEMEHDSLPAHDPSSCRERSPALQSRRSQRVAKARAVPGRPAMPRPRATPRPSARLHSAHPRGSSKGYDPHGDRSDFVAPSKPSATFERQEQSSSRPSAVSHPQANAGPANRYDPRGARSDVVAPSAPPGTQQARKEQAPKATTQLPKPRHPSEGTCKRRCTPSTTAPSVPPPPRTRNAGGSTRPTNPSLRPLSHPSSPIPSIIPVNKGIKLWEDSGEWGADALEMVNWEDFALENAWRERKQGGSG